MRVSGGSSRVSGSQARLSPGRSRDLPRPDRDGPTGRGDRDHRRPRRRSATWLPGCRCRTGCRDRPKAARSWDHARMRRSQGGGIRRHRSARPAAVSHPGRGRRGWSVPVAWPRRHEVPMVLKEPRAAGSDRPDQQARPQRSSSRGPARPRCFGLRQGPSVVAFHGLNGHRHILAVPCSRLYEETSADSPGKKGPVSLFVRSMPLQVEQGGGYTDVCATAHR